MLKFTMLLSVYGVIFNLYAAEITSPSEYLSDFEQGIIKQTNLARMFPRAYATRLEQLKTHFQGKLLILEEKNILTTEGVKAVDDAIRFLQAIQPVTPLQPSEGLSRGARDHVKDQGTTTATGHTGRDNSQVVNRVNRYGTWRTIVGENISYGPNNAEEVVMQLIINDGIPNRSHRQNIFNPVYRVMGVACGQHKRYTVMCVMTYADDFTEK